MKSYFARLRDRRHLQKLNGEKHSLIGSTPPCTDTKARVAWLNAALARAIKNGDQAEVERITPICLAAREEFRALLASEGVKNKPGNDPACAGSLVGVRQ